VSGVNGRKPDLKDMVATKAEELAEQRYGREFNDLPPSLQMRVWMDAEQEAHNYFACQADAIYDQMKEDALFNRENDHKPKEEREAFWADLEMDRRLGK